MKTFYTMIIVFIVMTTVGYSAMNQELNISGEAVFEPNHSFFEDFEYSGSCEEYSIPYTGYYRLETWGASGGGSSMLGYGGYSSGIASLQANTNLYICVGGKGSSGSGINNITAGGFNGGGNAYLSDGNNGSGGGATDIRIGTNSLYTRVIVAGGGGGRVAASGSASVTPTKGHGGGLSGITGICNYGSGYIAGGGSQTIGGYGTSTLYNGSFGQGGNGDNVNRAGGGGGLYGGGSTYTTGGGGSGYVFTNSAYVPAGFLLSNAYYLTNAYTVDGSSSMPTTDATTTMIGNQGNGFAKITYIGAIKPISVGTVIYNPSTWTNGSVIGTVVFDDPTISIINNDGSNQYIFNQNGSFVFESTDTSGIKGVSEATVTWIDKIAPDAFNISLTNTTTTSISVSGSTTDQGGSGIAYYYFSNPVVGVT